MQSQRKPRPPGRRQQKGSSLLEVLIAVLVMAIGMLGIAALQAVTLKNSNSSAGRSQAVIHIYSAFDTLRLNRAVALAGGYNVPDFVCETKEAEDGDDTDYTVFNGWLAGVQADLGPGSCGRMSCQIEDGDDEVSCKVGVQWDDTRAVGGGEEEHFEMKSRL